MDKAGKITDDNRIRSVLPTIRYILDNGGAVVLASHLGRPKGKPVPEFSLETRGGSPERAAQVDVPLAPDCIGPEAEKMVRPSSRARSCCWKICAITKKKPITIPDSAKTCRPGRLYVNDAFAVCHRENASVAAITKFFKVKAAGFLLKNEIEYYKRAMKEPKRPLVAIVGGAKISSKLGALAT